MLDLNHPLTQHRFEASANCDRIGFLASHMTIATTEARQKLLRDCQGKVVQLLYLNDDHFVASPFIMDALEDLDQALQTLARAEVDASSANAAFAQGLCPVCRTVLRGGYAYLGSPEERKTDYCGSCLLPIRLLLDKLDSSDGFGTSGI